MNLKCYARYHIPYWNIELSDWACISGVPLSWTKISLAPGNLTTVNVEIYMYMQETHVNDPSKWNIQGENSTIEKLKEPIRIVSGVL